MPMPMPPPDHPAPPPAVDPLQPHARWPAAWRDLVAAAPTPGIDHVSVDCPANRGPVATLLACGPRAAVNHAEHAAAAVPVPVRGTQGVLIGPLIPSQGDAPIGAALGLLLSRVRDSYRSVWNDITTPALRRFDDRFDPNDRSGAWVLMADARDWVPPEDCCLVNVPGRAWADALHAAVAASSAGAPVRFPSDPTHPHRTLWSCVMDAWETGPVPRPGDAHSEVLDLVPLAVRAAPNPSEALEAWLLRLCADVHQGAPRSSVVEDAAMTIDCVGAWLIWRWSIGTLLAGVLAAHGTEPSAEEAQRWNAHEQTLRDFIARLGAVRPSVADHMRPGLERPALVDAVLNRAVLRAAVHPPDGSPRRKI